MRIDIALVNLGLFESRTRAANAVRGGAVFYGDTVVTKPSFDAENTDLISVRGAVMPYVSRGGLKLEHALDHFHIDIPVAKDFDKIKDKWSLILLNSGSDQDKASYLITRREEIEEVLRKMDNIDYLLDDFREESKIVEKEIRRYLQVLYH